MKKTDINTALIENYFGLIRNLSPEIKLNLIEKITKTLKENLSIKENSIIAAFGAWDSDNSADDIIIELKNSRNVNRKIENL